MWVEVAVEPMIVRVLGYSSSAGLCAGAGCRSADMGQVLGWDVAASRSGIMGVPARGVFVEDGVLEGGLEGRVLFVADRTIEVMII